MEIKSKVHQLNLLSVTSGLFVLAVEEQRAGDTALIKIKLLTGAPGGPVGPGTPLKPGGPFEEKH